MAMAARAAATHRLRGVAREGDERRNGERVDGRRWRVRFLGDEFSRGVRRRFMPLHRDDADQRAGRAMKIEPALSAEEWARLRVDRPGLDASVRHGEIAI